MRRWTLILAVLALVAAACGDDGATVTTAPQTVGSETTALALTTTTGPTTGSDGGDTPTDFFGSPAGTAVVEIGDRRYEFLLDDICLTMFGAMGVAGNASDGSGAYINADFPPEDWESQTHEDWEPPSIRVDDDETDESWRAGDMEVGRVDSYTLSDGKRAVGEATFVELYASMTGNAAEVRGRFDIHCP